MAEIIEDLKTIGPGFARAFPAFAGFTSAMFSIYTGKSDGFFLLGGMFINEIINDFLKTRVAKPIMGNKNIPLLGFGKRPQGAKNTSNFLSEDIKEQQKLSTSYGMPSGHSQTATFFSTYLILHILNGGGYQDSIMKYSSIVFLTGISFFIMASRVYLNCHTIQQVVVGGFLGSIFGAVYYTLIKKLSI